MNFSLNHMTVPRLGYVAFLDLAAGLGCVGVEVRNDLERPLFDGASPEEAAKLAADKGLRLVGLSQVYPFNSWNDKRAAAVAALIATAKACGAETISLIPRNDGTGLGNGERQANLRVALKAILPMLEDAGLVALVEPLGFARSSLRSKQDLVETIDTIGGAAQFKLVHDTFHHALAGEDALFAHRTGIVHISGVSDPAIPMERMDDAHRGLVDAEDRLANIAQLAALLRAGFDGPVSYECFAPGVHALADPFPALRRSFDFISAQLQVTHA